LLDQAASRKERLKLAYITDVFPAVSLTFIYLELKKLRGLKMAIDFYAIWKWHEETKSKEAEFLAREATYLSPPSLASLFRAHCYYFYHVPDRYLQNLRLCLVWHPSIRLYRRTLYNFLLAPYFARMLERRRTSHIHAHFAFGAATTAMMASNLLNISFSFTAHGSDVLIEKCLLNEKLKKAKFVIAISEYNKYRLVREAPDVDRDKVKVIHCGVDPEIFYPVCDISGSPPVFLAVGSLRKEKGHVFLIEACRVLATNGTNFRCIIVGEGPNRHELEKLIMRHELRAKVELAGAVSHERIQSYFDRADVVVHPSTSEGIPVALMEAMSKGLPVIASRITGIPELVTHEEDGILVSPTNVAELVAAMERLLNNKELRKHLGKNARQKVSQYFNLNVNSRRLKKLFDEDIATEVILDGGDKRL
jgi:colanic acid/amylovoran biosynthesis glycosyltransferase